jgi:hypothetical protein
MQVFATSPAAVYTGIGNAFTRISSTEGMRALWRGVSSVILGAGPAHAVHFGMYEAMKELAGGNAAGNQWLATCMFTILVRSLSTITFLPYPPRLDSNFLAVCYVVGTYSLLCSQH